jgi:hypothetical protein
VRRAASLVFLCLSGALTAPGAAAAGEAPCWYDNGALVVPAAFGEITGDFILDVSAPRSQLHDSRAGAAGIEGASATGDLTFGDERLPAFPIEVADLDARSWGFNTNINGVLGADALAPFVVDISFSPCRVTLYRKPPPRWAAPHLKITRVAGVAALEATISDGTASRRGLFAIDTASKGVRVADATLSRAPDKDADPFSRGEPPARLRAVSLGGTLFEQTPAGLMKDAPAGLEGAIGDAIWSHYRMRLNLREGWIQLAPAPKGRGSIRSTIQ